jgi:hypothetical protein
MTLSVLEKTDQRTAQGILAAAALASAPNASGSEPSLMRHYGAEANEVLSEVRRRLHILDDSPSARSAVSSFLAKELERTVLGNADSRKILAHAGQAGRLPPALYDVEFTPRFSDTFPALGVRRSNVENAVKHPDDYQHLMTDTAHEHHKDVLSLFMKQIESVQKAGPHWLLIQTHRAGLKQVAQSAWRVFPAVVDIKDAFEPLHVLKAFVAAFGTPVRLGPSSEKFIESSPVNQGESFTLHYPERSANFFSSVSWVTSTKPGMKEVGIAYCIDLIKYRNSLKELGALL